MKTSQRIIESSAHSKHTTLTSSSTTSTDNSAFVNKFISQNETLKQIASSSNIIKHCCKQFPSNINNIFSSDKRKAQVLSYLKKLQHNNTQTQNASKTNGRLFNVSPIRTDHPIMQYKNVPMTSRNNEHVHHSTKSNMFTTYTSRVSPRRKDNINDMYEDNEHHQRVQTISLAGDMKRECVMKEKEKETTLLDKLSILDNSNYSDYCVEQGEISFEEDNNDIQVLYKQNEYNKKMMKNGWVITVVENGKCVKEYECPKEGDVNAVNEMLRKDKIKLMNKLLQFVDVNEYEKAIKLLKDNKNKKDNKCNWLSLLSHERAVNITYTHNNNSNSKRNKNKLKKQLTIQFEYSPIKIKKRNKGINTSIHPLQLTNNIQLSLLPFSNTTTYQDEQHSHTHTQRSLLEHSTLPSEHTFEHENENELRIVKQHKPSLNVIPKEENDILNMSITNSQIRNCISFSNLLFKDKGMQKDGNATMRSKAILIRKKFKRYYERQQHS